MLVLSRREGESIRIGDDIELVVTEVHGNHVKLGIRAPRHIPVHRKELLDRNDASVAETSGPTSPSPQNSAKGTSSNSMGGEAQSCQPYSSHHAATMLV